MSSPYGYDYWGLRLAAETAWPDLAPFALPAGLLQAEAAEVVIRDAPPVPALPLPEPANGFAHAAFVAEGVGRYDIRSGAEICVAAAPGASLNAIQLFLFGSAWGLLCYQRGLLPLHAGVVEVNGAGVAFCGPSGAGKSTLVASLVRRGHALISDDLCRVSVDAERRAQVWPGPRRFKLWRRSLERLGQDTGHLVQDLASEDKFHVPQPAGVAMGPRPLRDIYLLEWGDFQVERLTGAAALRRFVAASVYRGRALEQMGRLAGYWQACADLLRACRVFRLRQPADWSGLEAAQRWVEAGP